MAYPHYKRKIGRDFNFHTVLSVDWVQFGALDGYTLEDGYGPDIIIPFSTQGISFINYGADSGKSVEYSFNGLTVHGDMIPLTSSASLVFDNRIICPIWFRLKAGSTGPVEIRIEAWAKE